jgi:hypothetical protein
MSPIRNGYAVSARWQFLGVLFSALLALSREQCDTFLFLARAARRRPVRPQRGSGRPLLTVLRHENATYT